MRKLTMLVGVPGSGKSTFRESYAGPDDMIVSFDDLKEKVFGPDGVHEDKGKEFNGDYESAARKYHSIFNKSVSMMFEEMHKSDKNVILDATSLTEEQRHRFLRDHGNLFDEKIAVWVDTPLDVCLERNKARSRVVPESVIYQMNFNLEIPRIEEGFDAVYRYDSMKKELSLFVDGQKPTIFFDMDGVLADFDKGTELLGIESIPQGQRSSEEKKLFWKTIGDADHFYAHLLPIEKGVALFKELSKKYDCVILTGIPQANGGTMTAATDKIAWAKKYLGEDVKVYAVKRSNKERFCKGKNCVLIDDYAKNTAAWAAHNGKGIYFHPDIDTKEIISEVSKMAKKEFYGYDGIFFETADIQDAITRAGVQGVCLANDPQNYHITIAFYGTNEPTEEQKAFMEASRGVDVQCKIIGYGNDGHTEGFLCEGTQENGTPFHITLSFADGHKAAETGSMEFTRLDEPITITGKFHNSKDIELKGPEYQIDVDERRQDFTD